MMVDGNIDLCEGMKMTGNDNYMNKYMTFSH